jgi:biotin operon repressor
VVSKTVSVVDVFMGITSTKSVIPIHVRTWLILSDMYDPSMRVLAVLELMQSHETVTNAQLAKKLEVSSRSVQRYIVHLQDMGIPIEGKRGVGGHYRLRAGHRIPPLMFSNEEALTLVLGLHALQHLGLNALAPMTETVKAKLHRVMPHTTREHTQTLEQAVQIGASPWVVNTDFEQLQLRAPSRASAPRDSVRVHRHQQKNQHSHRTTIARHSP